MILFQPNFLQLFQLSVQINVASWNFEIQNWKKYEKELKFSIVTNEKINNRSIYLDTVLDNSCRYDKYSFSLLYN